MLEWLHEHNGTVFAASLSLILCIVGMVGATVLVVHLPVDFLPRLERNGNGRNRWGWKRLLQNIAGWGLIAAGLAMIVLPGPGIIALLVGVGIADFPGKRRVLRWLLSRETVTRSMNRVRARFGKPALLPVE